MGPTALWGAGAQALPAFPVSFVHWPRWSPWQAGPSGSVVSTQHSWREHLSGSLLSIQGSPASVLQKATRCARG